MLKLFFVAIAPSIALMLFIYSKDKYDREPLGMLLKIFLLGALSTIPAVIIESVLYPLIFSPLIRAAMVGVTEESVKLVTVVVFAFNSRYFNERLDGIVYSVFASLGFATLENIGYVFQFGVGNGIARAFLAVPGHMLFAVTMGYYLGMYKYTKGIISSKRYLIGALILPAGLHATYDYAVLGGTNPFLTLVIIILFVTFLWKMNLKKLNRLVDESKRQWREDSHE